MKKAFTLIELLVVIAIIGILAAMVLVALNSARTKAKDARIKGDIAGIRSAAEIYYNTANTYVGLEDQLTAAGTDIKKYADDVNTQNGSEGGIPTMPDATVSAWCVVAELATASQSICADSTGVEQGNNGATEPSCVSLACSGGTQL